MSGFNDKAIVACWKDNARSWVSAVRGEKIESRVLVTNQAIIDAVLKRQPTSVLDVGCGEGWLSRELENLGIAVLGIDASRELIDAAKKQGAGRFKEIAYEDMTYETIKAKFDVLVCNFSLLGNKSVEVIFQQSGRLLNDDGALIVQTIHPVHACGDNEYADGWRQEEWLAVDHQFNSPAPWYFRTMESWQKLFLNNGFELIEIQEPLNPRTRVPASVLFVGLKI